MIVRRSIHGSYLSNSYVVAAEAGGEAVIIDSGAPIEPLLMAIDEHDLRVTHVLNTHDHHDHTTHNVDLQERFDVPLLGAEDFQHNQQLVSGSLAVTALRTPGHTDEHVCFLVNEQVCFTGDVLFAGTVGGTVDGGPQGFEHLRRSVMDVLMSLDQEIVLYPGHSDSTTVRREWETNPFIRVWRGLDSEGRELAEVTGNPCTLALWAPDYDGGNKAWVRLQDGRDVVIGGSMVTRAGTHA